jgi:hypothetical protein
MKTLCRLSVLALFSLTAFAQQTAQPTTQSAKPAQPQRPTSTIEKIKQSSASQTAAQKEAEREKMQPAPTSTQQAPAPAPEFEKIAKLFMGRWRVTEKHEPSPWLANGGQGAGMETVTFGPGRISLIADYRSSGPMGPFQGHAIFTWDGQAKIYRSAWTDNLGGMLSIRTGKFEGNDLIMTGTDNINGQMTDFRESYTNFSNDGFTFAMDMSPAGKKEWKRTMTITYSKLGASMSPMMNKMRQQQPAPERKP